jgi:hypothetical protein
MLVTYQIVTCISDQAAVSWASYDSSMCSINLLEQLTELWETFIFTESSHPLITWLVSWQPAPILKSPVISHLISIEKTLITLETPSILKAVGQEMGTKTKYGFLFFLFFLVLEFDLRAWLLLGRYSTTWAISPALFAFSYFQVGFHTFCPRLALDFKISTSSLHLAPVIGVYHHAWLVLRNKIALTVCSSWLPTLNSWFLPP